MLNEGQKVPTTENIKDIEKKESSLSEVWLIEDDQRIIDQYTRTFDRLKSKESATDLKNLDFKIFSKSEDAYLKIQELLNKKEFLPDIIYIDKNLFNDQGDFRDGSVVIRKFRELISDLKNAPILVPHSSEPENNAEMAGDISFTKTSARDWLEFTIKILKERNRQ